MFRNGRTQLRKSSRSVLEQAHSFNVNSGQTPQQVKAHPAERGALCLTKVWCPRIIGIELIGR